MDTLEGRVAIVTGASSGIGAATAAALADGGARVALASRRGEVLRERAAQLESRGGDVLVVPTDVRDREQLIELVETTRSRWGRLDIVVNNAGIGQWERLGIAAGDLDEWRADIEVNLVAVMELTKLAAEVFLEQGHGHVVNVSSGAGRTAFAAFPSYVASKHGVNGFTYSAVRDLVPKGVRVTLVEPGEVDTPIQGQASEADRSQMLRPEDVADTIVFAVSRPPHVDIGDILVVPVGFNPSGDYV